MSIDLEALDNHIQHLQSQLSFLADALDATDREDPEWLAHDLIMLKGRTGILVDDMRRVRRRIGIEGSRSPKKNVKGKLSIEGIKAEDSEEIAREGRETTPSIRANPIPGAGPESEFPPAPVEAPESIGHEEPYQVQYVDISEEVNRRLHENRLRQLRDSPRTSQKRSFDTLGTGDAGEQLEAEQRDVTGLLGSPSKRIRVFGGFKQMFRLKDGVKRGDDTGIGLHAGGEDGAREDGRAKRRRI